ncbi:hypothetical protein SAY87_022899 [Trapa incisa]|uniref:Uncharacterized protein n=1 Tax=Trapa incisa TaxID=236973 RepID=A0AAN7Q5F8_9MYRT|nr:hypothetical protein SAY87_022899 [Trapa incisa]
MESSYFGEPLVGNARAATGGGSRKSKKSGSDKLKQPQRGLGVAQLEKIRLQGQMDGGSGGGGGGCLSSYGHFSYQYPSSAYPASASSQMGVGGDYERQSTTHSSRGTSHGFLEMSHHIQPTIPSHLSSLRREDPQVENHKKHGKNAQDLDLELRLSL